MARILKKAGVRRVSKNSEVTSNDLLALDSLLCETEEEPSPISVVVPAKTGRRGTPKPSRDRPWEHGMNAEQSAVINHTAGPLFCPAQAGTGKTRALVNRIARLVLEEGVSATRILAVTFSKAGATEMNTRLEKDLGISDCRVSTWHALAMQVIREDHLPQSVWVVDDRDRHKWNVKEALGYKFIDWKKADLTKVRAFIGWCKAHLWDYDSDDAATFARDEFGGDWTKVIDAYRISDELTHGAGLLTFDDMLVLMARYLIIDENAEQWGARWDYVLQDEAQDANTVQMIIARALAKGHRNYMIVGDKNQSIYGFRGSDPELFSAFPSEWSSTTIELMRNYRSARLIVETANNAIRPSNSGMSDMVAMRDTDGTVRCTAAQTIDDEAEQFVEWVELLKNAGSSYKHVTALYRTNAQSRGLEEALLNHRIPYVVIGGHSFYERSEIKNLLAYIRVATGRDKEGDALKRCINAPFRFLGQKFVDRMMGLAGTDLINDWGSVAEQASQQAGIQGRQKISVLEWVNLLNDIRMHISKRQDPGTILGWLVQKTGFLEWLEKEEGEESIETSHAANIRELIRVAGRFTTVDEMLSFVEHTIDEQKRNRKQGGDRVTLMSIHKSKGLEWPCVWVAGCDKDILPHAKGKLEEERRLFYVAATRARDNLVFSWVKTMATKKGVKEMIPSPFLFDAGLLPDSERPLITD